MPFGPLKAVPTNVPAPRIHILGVSEESACFAGERGLGYAFAHHFTPQGVAKAVARYRAAFRPSALRSAPHAIIATAVVCGATDAHAAELASSAELGWLRFGQGLRDLPLPSVAEALSCRLDADEQQLRAMQRARVLTGSPERVRAGLRALAEATGADEIMVTTTIHDHEERKRSYARLR